jgi:FtsH-binding integral membrane protein
VAAALALVGVVACLAATTYYLAEHPSYRQLRLPAMAASLPPVTAVVLAAVLAGCLWLALRPPRWLVPDRHGRRFAIAMALVLVAGFVLASRQELRSAELDVGVLDYLFLALPVVLLVGSAAAATVGRSFRAGLWACAWAVVLTLPLLVAAWLAEALRWHQQRGQLLLDGEGGLGLGANLVGANLGDAIWWSLVALVLWALPLGVIGAAAGGAGARRRRLAG